ncbi:MAG: hypothetical protein E6H07_10855 [Bacteroidetes bacterium]|nr:MAG: hypothetical protein E6H07_10855 [Bacteroidota bacterium]
MRKLLFISLAVFFYSCSTEAPKEDEVKEMVKIWYMQKSSADGAGIWNVSGVTVLSIKKDEKRKDIFNTISHATGTWKYPPLEIPKPDENFSDTVQMDLRWNGSKWVTANE